MSQLHKNGHTKQTVLVRSKMIKNVSKTAIKKQQGLVLVLSLLVLMSLTILGVTSVSSALFQSKMATNLERQLLVFDAAEAAISGVVFEAEDSNVLTTDTLTDPLTEARQGNAINLHSQQLSCYDNANWVSRHVTEGGLTPGARQVTAGNYTTTPEVTSWSKTAFVGEQACLGSSNVVGGSNMSCHVFLIQGCGQLSSSSYAVANTLTGSVLAPATGS